MPAAAQIFWKLRVPASVPFLFASMKVAIAASLVGAIVGELPTGAVAGIGARLLIGSYYSQTIEIWAALVAGSIVAGAAGHDRRHGRTAGRPLDGGAAGMSGCRLSWQALAALRRSRIAALVPLTSLKSMRWRARLRRSTIYLGIAADLRADRSPRCRVHAGSSADRRGARLFVGAHGAAWLLAGIAGFEGTALAPSFWLLAAAWLLAWRCVTRAVRRSAARRPGGAHCVRLLIPVVFGAWILILWEAVTRGAGIPVHPAAAAERDRRAHRQLAADPRAPTSTRPSSRRC